MVIVQDKTICETQPADGTGAGCCAVTSPQVVLFPPPAETDTADARPGDAAGRQQPLRWQTCLTVAILVLATILRWSVSENDLWLDEVWSVDTAVAVHSPVEILTAIHHDNNHYLNTFWLWCCGPQQQPILYRLVSLLTGISSVLLIGLIAHERGEGATIIAMLIAAVSALMVQYATEARGYASALWFALSAHIVLRQYVQSRSLATGLIFSAFCLGGILSHLSFLQYYFAAVYWTASAESADSPGLMTWMRRMVRCHGLAAAGIGLLYVVDVRHLGFGGGPREQAFSVLLSALSAFAGGPLDHPFRIIVAGVVVAGIGQGVRMLRTASHEEWKFYACLFVLFPVFRTVLLPPSLMFERYFLIPLGFAAIPLGVALTGLLRRGSAGFVAVAVLLLMMLVGNAVYWVDLKAHGRGGYEPIMRMMAADSPGEIRVSSDHPFRNRVLLDYYSRIVPGRPLLTYMELGYWSRPPQWMICHQLRREPDPPVRYFGADGVPRPFIQVCGFRFNLRKWSRGGRLSGCSWLCYELDAASAPRLTAR